MSYANVGFSYTFMTVLSPHEQKLMRINKLDLGEIVATKLLKYMKIKGQNLLAAGRKMQLNMKKPVLSAVLNTGLLAVILGMFSTAAHATFIRGSSALNVGLSPEQTLLFSELALADETAVSNQYSGVTFTPSLKQKSGGQCNSRPNFSAGGCLGNFLPVVNPFSIIFDEVVTEAGFHMVTNLTNQTIIRTFLNNVLVETTGFITTTNTDSATNFFAFKDSLFDEIEITVGGEQSIDAMVLDNLAWSTAVPEPSTTLILLTGLAGLGFMRRSTAN